MATLEPTQATLVASPVVVSALCDGRSDCAEKLPEAPEADCAQADKAAAPYHDLMRGRVRYQRKIFDLSIPIECLLALLGKLGFLDAFMEQLSPALREKKWPADAKLLYATVDNFDASLSLEFEAESLGDVHLYKRWQQKNFLNVNETPPFLRDFADKSGWFKGRIR